jgi:NADH-quinone oxidoreductase subunit L
MVSQLAITTTGGGQVMQFLWLLPVVPFAGAMVNLFVGKRLGKAAGWLGVLTMVVAFGLALAVTGSLLHLPHEGRQVTQHLFDWISVGDFTVGVTLQLDALSATMILVVTGVGALIHLYSISYMQGDPRFGRYFAYLNLFCAFMLVLVLAANFLLLYLGWEGVGLCSYLLIGFWYEKTANANAAKKAFITTRVGDTVMLVGLALIAMKFGSLDYATVLGTAGSVLTKQAATVIALLLFAGAVGKSAQIPLQVWLPDAMAGPTPVSALIHAATMVTAGVYLVVRTHVIFDISGTAQLVVLVTGLVTMLVAATCALAQDDIKRVLAYSTISQLGFMFVAAGLGAYHVAIFLLVVHALYKACMFLGAGSVMHGMHEETDMRRMGGLWHAMPVTALTFIVAALALSGAPGLSGFFAKDQILEVANHAGRQWVFVLGTIGAGLSAAYAGRMIFLTFFGKPRTPEAEQAHESPLLMTIPLVVLSICAAGAGLVLGRTLEGPLATWLEAVTGAAPHGVFGLATAVLSTMAGALAVLALIATWVIYGSGRVDNVALRERLSPLHRFLASGWYFDQLYDAVLVRPGKGLCRIVADRIDAGIIDGAVNGIAGGFRGLARVGRKVQTGFVRTYALALFIGVVALLVYVGTRL